MANLISTTVPNAVLDPPRGSEMGLVISSTRCVRQMQFPEPCKGPHFFPTTPKMEARIQTLTHTRTESTTRRTTMAKRAHAREARYSVDVRPVRQLPKPAGHAISTQTHAVSRAVGPPDRGLFLLGQSKGELFRVRCGAVCAPAMAALGDLKLIMADVTSFRTPRRPSLAFLPSAGLTAGGLHDR